MVSDEDFEGIQGLEGSDEEVPEKPDATVNSDVAADALENDDPTTPEVVGLEEAEEERATPGKPEADDEEAE